MTGDIFQASADVWERNDSDTELIVSTYDTRLEYLVAIGGDTLLAAARQLAHHPDAIKLKVASGEHLAGIIFSAFVGKIQALDADGGFDFVLNENADRSSGDTAETVVEMKSVAGDWRQHLRHIKLGQKYTIQIEDLACVLTDESPRILAAIEQLNLKMSSEDSRFREVFLAIHPFDRGTSAALSIKPDAWLTAPLPIPKQSLAIDGLWLLLFPSLVARWSRKQQAWTRYVVGAGSPEEAEHAPDLVDAEILFLEELETKTGLVHDVVWHEGISQLK